jgi:uncharacterized protein YgfB (UPF0149 family)
MARVTSEAEDYSSLAELLSRSGSPLHLSELHGGLCGVICAGGRDSARGWLGDMLDDCRADAATMAEFAGRLESLGNATWSGLCSLSLEFAPLLPEEDSAIGQRAEALGLWCHGFIAGLVIGGLDLSDEQAGVSEELTELVSDFAQISRAGAATEEATDSDTGEASLFELVEYVRVGAQYIFEELVGDSASAGMHTIH